MKFYPPILTILILAGCQPPGRPFNPAYRIGRNSEAKDPLPTQTVSEVLQEANESFTYRGKPIHPLLVQEFENWLSDLNSVTIAVDVSASFDSNEYSSEPYRFGDWVRVDTEHGHYMYKRIARNNDVHLLKTDDYAGGSQSFGSELWVRFEIWQGQYSDGEAYDQLVMRLVRQK